MTRPTLKLPSKTDSSPSTTRSPGRKPLRGGIAADKRRRPVPAAGAAPGTLPEAPGQQAPADRARHSDKRPAVDLPARPAASVKTYPPRGIARSTGVRAAAPQPRGLGEQRLHAVGTDQTPAPARPRRATDVLPPAAPAAESPLRGPAKELPRLAKLVSELTQCSRREADTWIENGWVTVDGIVVNRLGARVSPKAQIEVKASAGRHRSESVTVILNQPLGEPYASAGAAVVSLIRPETHWAADGSRGRPEGSALRGLAVVGKLAADEHGMLVLTQDGSTARRLTGGAARLENEYHLRVEGEMVADGLQRLRSGLTLDRIKLGRSQVSWLGERQLRFVVFENRKRQIQRMCELVGLRVTDIKRVRIGGVSLGRLPPGRWRYLRPDEHF